MYQVSKWDSDMTAEGGGTDGSDGVLPSLRAAEESLGKVEVRCRRVEKLLQLQEVCACVHMLLSHPRLRFMSFRTPLYQQRYRQDSGQISDRVKALVDRVADEEATATDYQREDMHKRSQIVLNGIKELQGRVEAAQKAYQSVGIPVGDAVGTSTPASALASQEGLTQLRGQIRGLAARLRKLRYIVEEEKEREVNGGEDDEDDYTRPPLLQSDM